MLAVPTMLENLSSCLERKWHRDLSWEHFLDKTVVSSEVQVKNLKTNKKYA